MLKFLSVFYLSVIQLFSFSRMSSICGLILFGLLPCVVNAQDECFDPSGDCTLANPVEFQNTIFVSCGDTVRLDPTQELCNTWTIDENVNFNYGLGDDSLVVFVVVDQCYPEALFVDGITNTPSGTGIASCDTRQVYHLVPAIDTIQQGLDCANFASLDSLQASLPSSCGCDSLLVNYFLDEIIDTTYLYTQSCIPSEIGISIDTLTAGSGCDSILITFTELNDAPALFLEDVYACVGEVAVLQAYALEEGTYLWNTGSNDFSLEVSEPGTYSVTFTGENGCMATQSATVGFTDISVELTPTVAEHLLLSTNPLEVWQGSAIEMEVFVSNTPFPYEIIWDGGPEIGDTTFNYIASSSGSFQVAAIDSIGCAGVAEVEILVRPIGVYVPTAFSPNGDNNNDFFSVYSSPNVEEVRLQIFSRTGGTVFDEQLEPTEQLSQGIIWQGWDGTYRGKRLNPQLFAYQLWYRAIQGEWKNISGEVSLVK
ncbi:T9SS type B sorting domain-containing protein [Lewinella cohaerens]|uniref:T9SS type B sorting domain-containing protein n=1 Tax=Lewinella cohaerens TaxID=70995 RepID=UPI0012EC76FC|nr:T9SS type B sorting domain-containing protein [Lewinella cohaerens]